MMYVICNLKEYRKNKQERDFILVGKQRVFTLTDEAINIRQFTNITSQHNCEDHAVNRVDKNILTEYEKWYIEAGIS